MKMPKWPAISGYSDIKLGFNRVHELLMRLGNPQLKLPPIIHVAGTNGKGSTIAFIYSILKEAGYKIHIYTSPHLVEFNERIVVANQNISDDFLDQISAECSEAADDLDITFFEGVTVAAFLAFSRVKADIILLETGLGGRLDATNIIKTPLLTVITPISMDHQDYLGDTIEKIATEKAGIIKKDAVCVSSQQNVNVINILKNFCKEFNNQLIIADNNTAKNYKLGLHGQHQIQNAATALSCIDVLRQNNFNISEQNIDDGLKNTHWQGRMQNIQRGKFVDLLPSNCQLWCDGGHNIAAAKAISDVIKTWQNTDIYLIIAMSQGKDVEGFLHEIKDSITKLYILDTKIGNHIDMVDAAQISDISLSNGVNCEYTPNISDAINSIKKESQKFNILVCGSLYLAGYFFENN